MKFKKIYIEISNICNLDCSFCSKSKRKLRTMNSNEFEHILKEINDYTDYIYLHVKGEPLLHSELEQILEISQKYNKKVCITTNGVLLKEKLNILKKFNNIYQINISLHSENSKPNYIEEIFYAVDILKDKCHISYRFWTLDQNVLDDKYKRYITLLFKKYNISEIKNDIKLENNVYISLANKFEWPEISDNINHGFCYGGKTHLAILSDGTVCICCLDSEGKSNLGNIFAIPFKKIIDSQKYKDIIESFKNNKCCLDICKSCSFKNRFK